MTSNLDLPPTISVAGSDSGAGAGIQADLLTFNALGVHGTTAITCVTAQNPDGVSAVEALPAAFVREQIEQVHRYFTLKAGKTGMLFNEPIIVTVADFLRQHPEIPFVVDPVMVATSGAVLLHPSAVEALKEHLLPLAGLITPNLDEAGVLLGDKPETQEDMLEAARELAMTYRVPVLLKGGHMTSGNQVVDIIVEPGKDPVTFTFPRAAGINTHGSGCTLSSAIAAGLAKGLKLATAVDEGLRYLQGGMHHPTYLNGESFIRH